ncbi:hypothetical protein [Paenibacillus elgii]|uniref:hypothetical protein n=1 Tax=Paenibacillus elgii TaxID=189691 RepID=UPI00203B8DDC|nr:hypothetical protein [Paenibacillus elgii]MCM3273041.1 hypothetical protein [Paenibacillus elgii]
MKRENLNRIQQKKKQLTPKKKREMLLAGGSIKTKYEIDTYKICREARGKQ